MNKLNINKMHRCLLSACLLCFSFSVVASEDFCALHEQKTVPEHYIPTITGLALGVDGQPLYCEYYYEGKRQVSQIEQEEHTYIEYWSVDKQRIATKSLSYPFGKLQPSVLQEDFRHGELREVSVQQEKSSTIEMAYRKPKADALKKAEFDRSENLIIDAGFDEALRLNWDHLIAGKVLPMNFASPVHLKVFKVSIKKVDEQVCGVFDPGLIAPTKVDNNLSCFTLRPSSPLLQLFAEPLLLLYDTSERRLLSYSGKVNITDEAGKSIKAKVYYRYHEAYEKAP